MELSTRNAELGDLATLLQEQHARKLDMVVPATCLSAENGVFRVAGAEPIIDEDGVTQADGFYRPTEVCDGGVSNKLSIPLAYLRKMRAERADLYDANVNGWLNGPDGPDPRSFMLRTFKGDGGGEGIARAFLSDRFKIVDHLDVLMSTLDGIRDAGTPVEIVGCDLTERRMRVRVAAPAISVLAPKLLEGYRPSPYLRNGVTRDRLAGLVQHEGIQQFDPNAPIIFAGFEIGNSETGEGSSLFTPRIVVLRCLNGMTMTKDALRSVHLGSKLDEGVIRWSDETRQKQLELVRSQARDAVKTFLDIDYVTSVIDRLEAKSDEPVRDAVKTVEQVSKQLKFSDEQQAGILDHFIQGGQLTAGGVMQAVTSYAQVVEDADEAADLEGSAIEALSVAASL